MKNGETITHKDKNGVEQTLYAAKATRNKCYSQDLLVECFLHRSDGCTRPYSFGRSCLSHEEPHGDLAQCIFVTKEEFLNLRILGMT